MPVGFKNGAVKFDEEIAVFYSGQVVSGNVSFDLDQTLNFSVLYIQYYGQAKVLWTEDETEMVNGEERENEVEYIGQEDYLNYTQNVLGGTGVSQLPAGPHTIPFTFQIPPKAPSTFKGSIGEINYKVTAVLVYADSQARDELIREFEVVAPFDLNQGDLKEPIEMEFEEIFGCNCFCSADPVTIRVKLPVSGYCPGQAIPIDIKVDNPSNVEITKIIFQLIKKEGYRSQQPESEYILPEEVMCKAKKGPIMSKSTRNFTYELFVPEFIAPYLDDCNIINVEYLFRVTIKLSGCNDSLEDDSEIYIGLVPIKELTEGEYVHPLAHSLPKGPIPVLNGPTGPVQSSFVGSNTNIAISQFNPLQSSAYPNNPSPYPSNNPPYPTENRFEVPVAKKPFQDYEIGFKLPVADNQPYPYPAGTALGNQPHPYPAGPAAGNQPHPYPVGPVAGNQPHPYPAGPAAGNQPHPYPVGPVAGNQPYHYPAGPAAGNQPYPYPVGGLPSATMPHYPAANFMPQVNVPPYPNGGFGPSAPPN